MASTTIRTMLPIAKMKACQELTKPLEDLLDSYARQGYGSDNQIRDLGRFYHDPTGGKPQ